MDEQTIFETNQTTNLLVNTGPRQYYRHTNFISALLVAAYVYVFSLGLIGNSIVVHLIRTNKCMRFVTNYFITNLAIADLLVLVVCVPATLTSNLVTPWILGLFLCKAVTYLQGVSVCASVNSLVAISVDRFVAICYPMKYQITSSCCRNAIVAIWIYSFTLTLPWTIYFKLIPIGFAGHTVLHVCCEVWPSEGMNATYFIVANLLLCYLLPLFVISVSYLFIWLKVWSRTTIGENQGKSMEDMIHRSKIKVVKMLVVVVVVFMLSWLPLYVIFARIKLRASYDQDSIEDALIQIATPLAQWLGVSNSCINPVLYAFFNSKFRAGFRAILFGNKNGVQKTTKMRPSGTSSVRLVLKNKMSRKSRNDVEL